MLRTKQKTKKSVKRYEDNLKQGSGVLQDPTFKVGENLKAEYDMWSWIYQEISNIRLEVSRLGTYVRVNNSSSPNFLTAYHAHIYSLMLPISVAVSDTNWGKIEKMWLEAKTEINQFLKERKSAPNKRIPFKLIKKLDGLYRIALLVAQKAGLGFKVSVEQDVGKAIENAVVGD